MPLGHQYFPRFHLSPLFGLTGKNGDVRRNGYEYFFQQGDAPVEVDFLAEKLSSHVLLLTTAHKLVEKQCDRPMCRGVWREIEAEKGE